MSCKIYCIEDCNGLKYVGSTTQKYLSDRLSQHRYYKKNQDKHRYSSCKLDLHNCKIYKLEECDISHRKERERYWINNTDSVNELKLNFDINDKGKKRDYDKKLLLYKKSWGGDQRWENNLLKIDVNLFLD